MLSIEHSPIQAQSVLCALGFYHLHKKTTPLIQSLCRAFPVQRVQDILYKHNIPAYLNQTQAFYTFSHDSK